jgi:uncharacterized protein YdeI (YjbR/CyaY-like superfamily)
MGKRDSRVDAYIAKSADFAKPVLIELRDAVHAACPAVEEDIKWGNPAFMYKGMMCGMVAFKQYAMFMLWKHDLIFGKDDKRRDNALSKLTKVSDLPPKRVLAGYIRQAAALNDQGVKVERERRPPAPVKVPAVLAAALKKHAKALAAFNAFSPSNQREYAEWITGAKTDQTRTKRLAQAIEWMAQGKTRNWKYETKNRD